MNVRPLPDDPDKGPTRRNTIHDSYREWLARRSLDPKTIRIYLRHVEKAQEWARSRGVDLADLSGIQAQELADDWPRSHSSKRQLRSALRHYWAMLGVAGPVDAIIVPKKPRPRWRGIKDERQVEDLIAVAEQDWPRGGVVLCGLYLGLRREEIATLRWSDFDDDMTWVTITGKDNVTDHLPVDPTLAAMLARHRWPGSEFVFTGRFGGHISVASVGYWTDQLAEVAGLGHLTPHQLRYTFGTKIYEETDDVYLAMEMLRHRDISSTLIYTRVADDRKLEGLAALNWRRSRHLRVA